jgi:predicted RND superfamily exporter protein
MWHSTGKFILRNGHWLLALLLAITIFMGWQASKVSLSYEFSKAIPTDNPKYVAYQAFRQEFGDDGNLLVIGLQTDSLFQQSFFNRYSHLEQRLKKLRGVEGVVAVPSSINLIKNYAEEKFDVRKLFPEGATQQQLDSSSRVFYSLPFYRGLLYNPETNAWLMAVRMKSALINSAARTAIVNNVLGLVHDFASATNTEVHVSGLPYIRTVVSDRIQREMKWFLAGSILFSAIILLLFFRSLSATLLSLAVVLIGVVWSVGVLQLSGYKITLLTALIPPLVVVIGIPNCIYFLNKYHTSYRQSGDRQTAILSMISKMGVVTLFCNIAAAIGFAVFALTESAILKEFGVVAGISIMLLFFISLVFIPVVLSKLAPPKEKQTRYLDNRWLQNSLDALERWALHHRRLIFSVTALILLASVVGIMQLRREAHIVDDLPKRDPVYADLKFFETHFKGVMPLEIVVDTKRKYGATRILKNLSKVDSLVQYLAAQPYIGKPLTITEGLKFARQAFFDGDSSYYAIPGSNDLLALKSYVQMNNAGSTNNAAGQLASSFLDSNHQKVRISAGMKDIGSERLPVVLASIRQKANELFDTAHYHVEFTGTSVTFLEGSRFIINGLKESVFWAFLLIALCMLYLFKSLRILLCSLVPNLVPLVITAGVMGWAGIPLKPSTVLVFSVALGIAIDITIRFLVNYKQQLADNHFDPKKTVVDTIHATGLSIIYTSVVLTAGFVIFCFSGFGGTQALGWLTSLTLVTATLANLVLLPAILISLYKERRS